MNKLALTVPGFSPIPQPSGLNPQLTTLGGFLSGFLNIVFYVAIFLAFYWLIWGGFQYILARGDKENLAKARAKIMWALIGLMVVFVAYLIARYAFEIFPPRAGVGGVPF